MSSPIPDIQNQQPTGPAGPPVVVVAPPPAQPDPTAWLTAIAKNAANDVVTGQWQGLQQDVADLKAQAAQHPDQVAALEARIAALESNPAQAVADARGLAVVLADHRDAILAEVKALTLAGYRAANTAERAYIRYGLVAIGVLIILATGVLDITGNGWVRANTTAGVTLGAFFIGLTVDLPAGPTPPPPAQP